jgi:hypothetical protein
LWNRHALILLRLVLFAISWSSFAP